MSSKVLSESLIQSAQEANLAIARYIAVPHDFSALRRFLIELGESEDFFERWAVEKGYTSWRDFTVKATINNRANFSNSLELALKAKKMYEDSIQD